MYVFGALALILWYALFTYDPADPSWSQATTDTTVSNGIGLFGAHVAGLLFTFFGRPAYLFTVMIVYLGWMLYREQKTQIELTGLDFGLRFSGFLALRVARCRRCISRRPAFQIRRAVSSARVSATCSSTS